MYSAYRESLAVGKTIVARHGTPKMAQGWLNDRRWEDESEATKRDQAQLCRGDAVQILKNCQPLRKIFTVLRDNLSVDISASKFEPVGRDSDSLDGLNVSGAIMDELHAWKNRDLWSVIDTDTGAGQ